MKKILLVDDDISIQRLYKLELEDDNYELYQAYSGVEALLLFNEKKPDVVILDILMPDIDGIQVLKMMKEKNPNVSVIMNSAFDRRDEFVSFASDAYITKQADCTELKDALERSFSKKAIAWPNELKKDIEQISTKTDNIVSESTILISYGNKIKKQIDRLTELILLINNQLEPKNNKNLFKEKRDFDRAARYSYILTEHYKNVFFRTEQTFFPVNINNKIDDILDILSLDVLSPAIAHNLKKDYRFKEMLETDEKLLDQILFVIFKNINDYLLDSSGYLTITTDNEIYSKKEKQCIIKFKFGISNELSSSSGHKKILIVDDEKPMRDLLSEIFSEVNYKVYEASDGFQCLDFVADEDFNLIILDMKMFGMEGYEVLETLRRNRKNINVPVIIYSAYDYYTKASFKERISIFNPVETLLKSDNTDELLSLANKLTETYYKPFSFKDIFFLNINESIRSDYILRLGFFVVRKILKLINGDIDFNDGSGCINLKIPILPDKNQAIDNIENNQVEISYLKKLNDHFRHDLKSKLRIINSELIKTTKQESEAYKEIYKIIIKCIDLLDEMKDIPII